MRVLVGMEFSGRVRDAFIHAGHDAMSCDLLPTEVPGPHYQGDVFDIANDGWDLAIFHPDCTFLTNSAEWAFGDGPYHQHVRPGTLVGAARREARELAVHQVKRLMALRIPRIALENPKGALSSLYRKPDQVVHPHWFGDDASKATCLWLKRLPPLVATSRVEPRHVAGRPRWGNQTDGGQNRLTPSPDRWKERSRTYPGFANAMAAQWGNIDVSKRRGGWEKAANSFYPTTKPSAVTPLLRYVPAGTLFFEPCAGAGDLISHLAAQSRLCVGACDISPRGDFIARGSLFDLTAADLNGATMFITNPPHEHDVLAPIIEHLRSLLPTWLLLPLDWAATKQAIPFMRFCTDLQVVGRQNFIPGTKSTGYDNFVWARFQAAIPILTVFRTKDAHVPRSFA